MQHDFPRSYDLIIVVRPHEPQMLADYQRLLAGAFVIARNTALSLMPRWRSVSMNSMRCSFSAPGNYVLQMTADNGTEKATSIGASWVMTATPLASPALM